MAFYSQHTGAQVDEAVDKALTADAVPTKDSTNLVQSGGVASAVSAVQNTVSRRNLLNNWYFVGGGSQQGGGQFPVNQRGQTSYSGAVYGIDRWKAIVWNATPSVTVNSGNVQLSGTAGGTNTCLLRQTLENPAAYAGKTVTVSVLVGSLSATQAYLIIRTDGNDRYKQKRIYANGLYSVTATLPSSLSTLSVDIGQHASAGGSGNTSIEILAIKLELGDTQTLAHNEGTDANPVWVLNDIPNYAEELAKCQRYCYVIKAPAETNLTLSAANALDVTNIYAGLSVPPQMRTPTLSLSSSSAIKCGTSAFTITPSSVSVYGYAAGIATMKIMSTSLTTGTTYRVGLTGGESIIFSADL